jgi:phosphoribosylaminoimidazole-succinocarboxamide synthase
MIATADLQALLTQAFAATDLPLPDKLVGKVRESYPLDNNRRLIITTDRFSAFDRVLAAVPYKGQVLNQLAAWWFAQTADIIPNHVVELPDPNALIAIETEPFPIEVIVRGYISGVTSTALWYRYAQGERDIYGYHFPEDLQKNQALPEPIITPTTKGGPTGHDERLTCAEVTEKKLLDDETWQYLQEVAIKLFKRGQTLAKRAGLLLVDTKYEFGRTKDDKILLIDEVHTPDSSRYWRAENYQQCFADGIEPENFDKEFIRLAYVEQGYRGEGVPPTMSDDLWITLSQRFIKIYEMLTGEIFMPGEYPVNDRLLKNTHVRQTS